MALFVDPDWNASFDLEAYLAAIPATATTKGMFFDSPIRQARERAGEAPGREHYSSFKDYPIREYVEVIVRCAELGYPESSVREGLRQIGRRIYPAFFDTMIGKVIFKFAGDDIHAALRAVPRAYKISTPQAEAEIRLEEERRVILALRHVWDVPEASQVGVFEGGLESFGLDGQVRVRVRSLSDVDLELSW
jgi:uncharacterized protein (TIGR02265 family)